MSPVSGALDALRQPEYTGENRCLPCTLVNALVATALATAVAVAVTRLAGVAVLVASFLVIGLRGYLVPGTPALTKRYLPDRVLALFDKQPATAESPTADSRGDVDVEGALVDAGVLAPCADRDDLCLDDAFRAEWRDAIRDVRDRDATPAAVADLLDVDADGLSLQRRGGGAFVATHDGVRVGQWESEAALLADAAAADLLAARDDDWRDRPAAARGELLGGLRLFLDACPGCGGPASVGTETVESCCRSRDVVAVSCDDCGARLFEADHPAA